jgi:acyl phosphate:glycerol-3-phosphate acyltransferase
MSGLFVIIIAYIFGSLPTAYIAGRLVRRADIRTLGGGNMGALNATRELGSLVGGLVLLVDIAKGAGAVLIAEVFDVTWPWVYTAGLVAVLGHCWPLFLKFRGGKGAATAIGVCLALATWPFLCCVPIMLVVIAVTSNVTLGMAAGFVFLPLFLWLFHQPFSLMIFLIVLVIFLGFRYIGTARRNLQHNGWRDFIIERNYTPWQRPKKPRDDPGPDL